MQFDMAGATKQYVDLEIDYDGVEYTGDECFVSFPKNTTFAVQVLRRFWNILLVT